MVEKHVTSFKVSKKLSELCFFKYTNFYWRERESGKHSTHYGVIPANTSIKCYPAYLLTELIEWLESKENIISPSLIDINKFIDDKSSKCDSLAKIIIHILEEIKK